MTYFFGKKGNEVSLELGLDELHHVPHLGRLTHLDEAIDRQQTLSIRPLLTPNVNYTYKLYQAITDVF